MRLSEILTMFNNGQDVVDHFKTELDKIDIDKLQNEKLPIQPVSLLLLDINMPLLDGFETLKAVKGLFDQLNERLRKEQQHEEKADIFVLRPTICFFSQFTRDKFIHFFTEDEQPEFYLEKPLALKELASLLKLISIL